MSTTETTAGIEQLVQELADFPGVDGCALVEAETGMVWYHAGRLPMIERVGEAAIEFWRVQQRLSPHFDAMGPLQSAAYAFAQRVVALFPCSERPALVLVCVAAKPGIAWGDWRPRVQQLQQALRRRPRVSPA